VYSAPVDGPDGDDGDTDTDDGDGTEGSDPVDHGTTPGPDAENIHDALRAYLVAYIGQHESPADGVKNAARILSEAATLCETADEPAAV
jgi:hypothetical protein